MLGRQSRSRIGAQAGLERDVEPVFPALRPQAHSGECELSLPTETARLRIHFPGRRDIGMAKRRAPRGFCAGRTTSRESPMTASIWICGKRSIAELMAGIDDFDSCGNAHSHCARRPTRSNTQMPRAAFFRNVGINRPVLVHGVVGAHFGVRIARDALHSSREAAVGIPV